MSESTNYYDIMKKMIFLRMATIVILMAACAKSEENGLPCEVAQEGVSVSVRFDDAITKSSTMGYVTALEEEQIVKRIDVLVFDKETKNLNSIRSVSSLNDSCRFTLPVGEKIIYAVVNGPDLSDVNNIAALNDLTDNLANRKMSDDGLALMGCEECNVVKGTPIKAVIKVRWLVARVVLHKVTCNLPAQHKSMKIDYVYLGNAHTMQTFGGTASGMANAGGYEGGDKDKPIGMGNVVGECPEYMFRNHGATINAGDFDETKIHMYCQPNLTPDHTCLYLLTTISGEHYYYRVPLNLGLTANSTCSVEVSITNLGSTMPPVGDYETNKVTSSVLIEGWTSGNSYVAEF